MAHEVRRFDLSGLGRARYELLTELMDVLKDESRSILFSSHNTTDVERI